MSRPRAIGVYDRLAESLAGLDEDELREVVRALPADTLFGLSLLVDEEMTALGRASIALDDEADL